MISYQTDGVEMPSIKKRETTEWIKSVAATYGKRVGEIAYIFCSDEKILEVNRQYLQHDYYTDIITFDYCEGNRLSGDDFVDDCAVESDLEMYFPDTYVPGSSERMLLYRELDKIEDDRELAAYRQRLVDRFGPVPHEGEELMHVVRLRRLGKRLGCEKIILRQGMMQMQFVGNVNSPFYQSHAFSQVITYATQDVRRAKLKEKNNRRLMSVSNVPTIEVAVGILDRIEHIA